MNGRCLIVVLIKQKKNRSIKRFTIVRSVDLCQSFPTFKTTPQQHPITLQLQSTRLYDLSVHPLQLTLISVYHPSIEKSTQHLKIHFYSKLHKSNQIFQLFTLSQSRIQYCHLLYLLFATDYIILLMAFAQLVFQRTSPFPFKYVTFQEITDLGYLPYD